MTERSDVVRRVPDADLGAIFGNRTDGLGGLAPRRPRPAAAPTPAADTAPAPASEQPTAPAAATPATPVVQAGEAPATTQPTPTRPKSGGARTPSAEPKAPTSRRPAKPATPTGDAVVPRLVILQLPNGIADQMRDHARSRGVTYKELSLDAVEATADKLPDLLAAARPQARGTGLFAGEHVAAQKRPEGRRQVSIKLTEGSIAALDDLASRVGARSRSELVATALSAYLSD